MADTFLLFPAGDRLDALRVAADRSGRPAHLLEKNVWVVWALATLYGSSLGEQLVFKGGASLSKAYGIIRRFSEDVYFSYDIRALAPDLVGDEGGALPKTRSEKERWASEVRKRLSEWVAGTIQPVIAEALPDGPCQRRSGRTARCFSSPHEATMPGSGYVAPSVMLEFGAHFTGEAASPHDVTCDAAGLVERLTFQIERPRVRHAERTFWEKATAIHGFCLQERLRGDRFARHRHDVERLDEAGLATVAFAEKATDRSRIDCTAAVNGGLHIVPAGGDTKAIAADCARMVDDGLLLKEAEPFDALMARCTEIAARANGAAK